MHMTRLTRLMRMRENGYRYIFLKYEINHESIHKSRLYNISAGGFVLLRNSLLPPS